MPPDSFGVPPARGRLTRLRSVSPSRKEQTMRKRIPWKLSRIAFAAAGGIASGAAIAAQPGAAGGFQELQEVVVTAERREVNLQDVPASATVLNADALAAQGVDNVLDLQNVAPSVAINTYNRSTFINIRGVGIGQSAPTSN